VAVVVLHARLASFAEAERSREELDGRVLVLVPEPGIDRG
jgi:hypothetical protein